MDTIAAKKRTAMHRYARLRKITTLLRCAEAVAAAAVALWLSAQIPAVARSSGDLLRRLLPVLLGPRFLFLLGNAIVLTLFFKSRPLPADDPDISLSAFSPAPPAAAPPPAEQVVFEDKEVVFCPAPPPASPPAPAQVVRACRRSKSERMMGEGRRRGAAELRRSETEVKGRGEEDEEEFRRTIEAFIERQWKFQREESMAIVCSADSGLNCSAGTLESQGIIV